MSASNWPPPSISLDARVDCGTLDAVVPVQTCALRQLKRHASLNGGPVFPDCASCFAGSVFRSELERIGWRAPERIALTTSQRRAAFAARTRWMRENVTRAA